MSAFIVSLPSAEMASVMWIFPLQQVSENVDNYSVSQVERQKAGTTVRGNRAVNCVFVDWS